MIELIEKENKKKKEKMKIYFEDTRNIELIRILDD